MLACSVRTNLSYRVCSRQEAVGEYKGSPSLQAVVIVELQAGQLLELAHAVEVFWAQLVLGCFA